MSSACLNVTAPKKQLLLLLALHSPALEAKGVNLIFLFQAVGGDKFQLRGQRYQFRLRVGVTGEDESGFWWLTS